MVAAVQWSTLGPPAGLTSRTTRPLEVSGTRYTNNPWTPRNCGISAMSSENDARSTSSGHFAGLSSLKEQLLSGREAKQSGLPTAKQQQGRRTPPETEKAPAREPPPSIRQPTANGKDSVALLVANLPKELTKAEFESLMLKDPQVARCTYLTHKSGDCRSYGFCELRPGADVTAAIELLNRQTVGGRLLRASIATGKKESLESTPRISSRGDARTKAATTTTTTSVKNFKASPNPRDERESDGGAKSLGGASNSTAGGRQSSQQQQQQLGTVTRLSRAGAGPSKPPGEASQSGSNAPLSGQKVLDALERFARQRKAIGETPGNRRVSSDFKAETDGTDESEPEPVQVRPDWPDRIASLEAQIQHLRRL
ncbi:hypothetical protein MPTK1_1g12530 [Marchantia polymorpha subsp. ruderalis]|nr:hypothetical protein MARPO_0019s0023 [Marchantia polymorpha]BBM98315.1 hypothetical protein Mp_1g12530 [Marchantia polymorpha subsp. ruderalis]|eukprot:PTQ44582.1 hypothetical protein MARPO_0019s0023 [Marchantia polymorpha]